jgi:SAM-dependent methyltransferase
MSNNIKADFDRIAALPADPADGNARYHRWLLDRVPAGAREALDLGCGSGDFARLLASRVERVLAVDLSPQMIALARQRSQGIANLEFQQMDALDWQWPENRFDCIVSITCLHHLPMEPMIEKIKAALRPGGVLLIVDLRRCASLFDHAARFVTFPADRLTRLLRTGTPFLSRAARRAWDEHAATDRYLSMAEVRQLAGRLLPGAEVRWRLYWRYSLVWQKPA